MQHADTLPKYRRPFTSSGCHDILAGFLALRTCRRVCMGLRKRSVGAVAVLAMSALGVAACGQSSGGDSGGTIELTIAQNAIAGGKNAAAADFLANWVAPKFEAAEKAKGKDVKVKFIPSGVDDEQYKTKL